MRIKSLMFTVLSFFFIFSMSGGVLATSSDIRLGISYPPLKTSAEATFSTAKFTDLNVNSFRVSVVWSSIQPDNGTAYVWGYWDAFMQYIDNNDYNAMLTFESNGPGWIRNDVNLCSSKNERSCALTAAGNTYFTNYVSAFISRYSSYLNRIKVQFGNEWASAYWYSGSASDFLATNNAFYNAVKNIQPNMQVILGGYSIGTLRILAVQEGRIDGLYDDAGIYYDAEAVDAYLTTPPGLNFLEKCDTVTSQASYDVLDIHLYDDYENWPIYFDMIIDRYVDGDNDFPVIVSEFGGPHPVLDLVDGQYSEAYHAQLYPYYINALNTINNIGNLIGAYNFSLVDFPSATHCNSGLIWATAPYNTKCVYQVFKNYNADK